MFSIYVNSELKNPVEKDTTQFKIQTSEMWNNGLFLN